MDVCIGEDYCVYLKFFFRLNARISCLVFVSFFVNNLPFLLDIFFHTAVFDTRENYKHSTVC